MRGAAEPFIYPFGLCDVAAALAFAFTTLRFFFLGGCCLWSL